MITTNFTEENLNYIVENLNRYIDEIVWCINSTLEKYSLESIDTIHIPSQLQEYIKSNGLAPNLLFSKLSNNDKYKSYSVKNILYSDDLDDLNHLKLCSKNIEVIYNIDMANWNGNTDTSIAVAEQEGRDKNSIGYSYLVSIKTDKIDNNSSDIIIDEKTDDHKYLEADSIISSIGNSAYLLDLKNQIDKKLSKIEILESAKKLSEGKRVLLQKGITCSFYNEYEKSIIIRNNSNPTEFITIGVENIHRLSTIIKKVKEIKDKV